MRTIAVAQVSVVQLPWEENLKLRLLLVKELLIRGDLERCLIVAPGGLVEQWQEELIDKFGLAFELLTRDQIEASITGNPFVERNRLIVRLDMPARSDELRAKIEAAPDWDLIVCDEAHRRAASYFGGEVKETQRPRTRLCAEILQTRIGICRDGGGF